jgi:hypothetical protein
MMPISIMNEVGGKENYDPNTAAFFLWSVPHEGIALPARGSEGSKTSEYTAAVSCTYRARIQGAKEESKLFQKETKHKTERTSRIFFLR